MFQKYQLKWCFILIGILAVASSVRVWDFKTIHLSQYFGQVTCVALYAVVSWLIIAYFKLHHVLDLNKQTKTGISIVLGMLVSLVLNYLIVLNVPESLYISDPPFEPTVIDFFRRFAGSILLTLICYVVYNTLYTNDILQQTRLENQEFKQAHLRAQLLSLQQQISPHFLFNSLSTLKNVTNEAETKTFVVQLSRVYRYLLSINEYQTITLAEELRFIEAYLYIQNTRFEQALNVTVNIPSAYHQYLIPPLSLQLLIENAIKHNIVSEDDPLHIAIYVSNQQEIIVNNPYQPLNYAAEGTKLGLQNIRDRYRLLFNKEITVKQTPANFTIILPLIGYENHHH